MPIVSVRLMAAAVYTRLTDPLVMTVYQTAVTGDVPSDSTGKVSSYGVFHPGAGNTIRSSLDAVPGSVFWNFQVTCVGGDHDYLLGAVDFVRDRLEGKTLTVAGAEVGLIQPPPGFTAPPARPDHDDRPTRLWIPLPFQVLAVPA